MFELKHNHPGYSNCPRCVRRIAELEAELAAWKAAAEAQDGARRLAEAEVERLKKEHAVLVGPSYEDALHAFHELRDFTTGSGRP